jgi:hypothetical protein
MKLDKVKLGIAAGLLWGFGLFMISLLSSYFGYGTKLIELIMDIYPGYNTSLWGCFLGLVYGFADGFFFFFFLAWIYNALLEKDPS